MGRGTMRIGIIDVDGHNWPNLALMKLSAWHKAQGDTVEWWWGFGEYDRVYMSKVFDETYSPDYSLYPELTRETAYGFLTRGCPRGCSFCIVAGKEGRAARKVADLSKWWRGQKNIKLLDPNLLACREHMDLLGQLQKSGAWVDFTQGLDCRLLTMENIAALNMIKLKEIHFAWDYMAESGAVVRDLRRYATYGKKNRHGRYATVYVLTNYNTTMRENLFRIYNLRDMGFDPYVMIYDKPNAPREIRLLQRWCNNRLVFRAEPDFYKYDPKRG